jgi:SAM-dependent methyltransferase
LDGLPDTVVEAGAGCGNPTAIARLKQGEVVVDLGSGGGIDCCLASQKVGSEGRVIGVDMTPEMIRLARANAKKVGASNVEFRLGELEHLPVQDGTADVIISNCVINLSPDKPQVWREIARVLKPGGRVAVSDLALLQPLPDSVRQMGEALIGCVAGALLIEESERLLREVGLVDLVLEPRPDYVRAMTEFNDPLYVMVAQKLPAGQTPAHYITSLSITARKNGGTRCCCQ